MLSDKEIKNQYRKKAQQNPEKNYPVKTLTNLGFERRRCAVCNIFFWTTTERQTCDNPPCAGGFRFIGKSPAKQQMGYIDVWKKFSTFFKKFDYTPVARYPVVARWNPTTDFTIASIAAFQPYVVRGEIKPPANPLVIPQLCLRFNDIDNVGLTGSHYTLFSMIGQHCFVNTKEYDINRYLREIYAWLNEGMKIKKDEITFHEDVWAGAGNFGPSVEFFSRGLEIGNQVYMQYEQTENGPKDLHIKVLDMGMGHERCAWFTQGTSTSYETTFPTVCKKLFSATGIKTDKDLMKKFLPYSSYLNVDEVDDINKVWKDIAKKIEIDEKKLREKINTLAALFSIAEHSRSLLVAINDGALPSNVGGGHNLRMLFRRALTLMDKYSWRIDFNDLVTWHAEYLKPIFPELSENLENVKKIMDVEKSKYQNTKQKINVLIPKILKEKIDERMLLEMYDSQGISPELLKEEAKKERIEINVPDNFYAKVAELHEKNKQEHATKKEIEIDFGQVPATKALYFTDYEIVHFSAKVLKIVKPYVVLDKTYFYPTSGGQLHDTGIINNCRVKEVFKQGEMIVHVLEEINFKERDTVNCLIDEERRFQLAKHHTATHIINAAARRVLGRHVNQAGAKKDVDKAHIDITHYQSLTEEELKKIEEEANLIVDEKIATRLSFMPRDEAEKKYGMDIYQGGAVPGKELRIVEIPEVDVECCGGTHLKNTFEAKPIKLLKANKISDSVVRIEFKAGEAAEREEEKEQEVIQEAAQLLRCTPRQVPKRAEQLLSIWKNVKKMSAKNQIPQKKDLELTATEEIEGDMLSETAKILSTQPEHVVNTLKRFLKDIEKHGK